MLSVVRSVSIRVVIAIFTFSMISVQSNAQPNSKYYQSEVPVKSQTRKERNRAERIGLREVLLRVSGSVSSVEDPNVVQKIQKAPNFVDQYQYLPLEDEALLEQGFTEIFAMSFSPAIVRKILSDAQQPFWSNRPSVLVWLVEDNQEYGRQLLNEQSDVPVIEALAQAGYLRGIELSYPLLDLEDQLALSADDVWETNEEAILGATERYGADVILVGRYSQTSQGQAWSIWQYFHAGATSSYDSRVDLEEENSLAALGQDALYPLADFLASRYAIQPELDIGGQLVVQIEGVDGFGDYRKTLSYLESLAAVSKVKVDTIQAGSIRLILESEASVDRFLSVLRLENKLAPIEREDPVDVPVWQQIPRGTDENPLVFSWAS